MKIGDQWVPLSALSTFEVAARHGHMGRAAAELNVTQSAVSHQVRNLERTLGITLFERIGRRLAITYEGTVLMKVIRSGLDDINSTVLTLQRDAFSQELTVMASVSLMTEWLTPKLSGFLEKYPQLNLHTRIAEKGISTIPSDVDVAIIFDRYSFDGRVVSPLLAIHVFPVCSACLVTDVNPLNANILRHQTLIHEDDGETWHRWFVTLGIEPVSPRREIYAGSHHDALEFARRGAGFAMTDWFLGREDITSGRLVLPFGSKTIEVSHYYMAERRDTKANSPAGEFARWLQAEVDKEVSG